jgi:creatinine amidohydrolase
MRIEDMTTEEFARAMKSDPLVFLPLGATEGHGPHLPLSTDSLQPEWLCEALADRFDGLVAPLLSYGQHSSTRNMAGTLSLRAETLKMAVIDILESLERHGARKVVVVSGHAGMVHLAAVKGACEEFVRKTDASVMVLTDYDIAYKFPIEKDPEYPDGHGGLIETSRILAIKPELVKTKRERAKFIDPHFMITKDPERFYPQGFVGDAAKATANLGNEINEFIFKRMVELIEKNFEA